MKAIWHTEWVRKGLHLATVGIPLTIWFMPRSFWQWPLIIGTIIVVIIELIRFGHPGFGALFRRVLGPYMRRHEQDELMGSTYLTIACLLSAFLLPREIAVAVMGYLILGDGLAGLVGRTWGRIPIGFHKTLEGTVTGFLVNLGVGLLIFRDPVPALVGAAVASAAEYLPIPLDDNLAIPLASGVVLVLSGL
ncbi:MAG: hypothetical protein GY835_20180 [bacterium]|nr:hypothetical protein [bacterium]